MALLRQVDLFILYFRNIDGYAGEFRIPRERIRYVPFKVNGWEEIPRRAGPPGSGDYVLLAGATLRDHATFVEAARRSGVPALVVVPGDQRESVEKAAWYRRGLPPNLRIAVHDDGNQETYIGFFERARVLCIPRFRWDIASSGISSYLYAMALGKCVLISRGPGAEDVLADDEAALFFESENAADLAALLATVWTDAALCTRIAGNGKRYADSLQGEDRLMRDIVATLGIGR
jgi:glycosyltransferase involved in cell wall biosynthesis